MIGIRVGVKTAGCSGMQYDVQFATEQKPFEDKVEQDGVTLFIDPTAVMFLIGSQMDWQEDKFSAKFVFNNPNELARCGCGESFSVSTKEKSTGSSDYNTISIRSNVCETTSLFCVIIRWYPQPN